MGKIKRSKANKLNMPPPGVALELADLIETGQLTLLEQKAGEAIRRWPKHFIGWKGMGILRLMQARYADALEPLVNTVKFSPNDAQAHQNLGSAYLGLGLFAEAEASFRQALAVNPDYPQAHNNLGITLMNLGRLSEAEESYRTALAVKADFFEARNNLGNLLKDLGRLSEAEESYRMALTINTHSAEAHQNLGNVLMVLNRLEESEESYQRAIRQKPDYAKAYSGLGAVLVKEGKLRKAISAYKKAIACDAMLVEAHEGLDDARKRLTPLWHVPMMNDHLRNDAYFSAMRAAITPDLHVLEIGTGSGLLAMMAAKLDARRVTTCEAVSEIAATARDIVAANNYSSQIEVIAKMSTKLEIGADMDKRADLLVSEILSSEFLGEGVLSSIEDAKRRLLKPGAQVIPAGGSIQFALFGGEDIEKNLRVEEVHGFDLRTFNAIVPRKQYISRNDLHIELFSDDTCAFAFDFMNTEQFAPGEQKTIDLPVKKAGRCLGIIQWIRLEMDDTVHFENHPSQENPASGWQHAAFLFPDALDVRPGQVVTITAAHNRISPWFFFQEIR